MRVVPLLAYFLLGGFASALPDPNASLVELAKKRFAPRKLTNAEIELFKGAQNGQMASALIHDAQEDNADDDPKNCSNWPKERVVNSESLKWLLTDKEASSLIKYNGVELRGMRVDGDLDLSDADIRVPVFALKCAFTGNFYFKRAHIKGLYLVNCCVTALNGNGARITDAIFLRHGSRATGEVNLLNAIVGGNVDCERAELLNPKGVALNADGAKIDGNVFLRKGFRAEGEINFVGATIGGNFECDGAQIANKNGKALNADTAKIVGGLYLGEEFKADGEVNFALATVGRSLACDTAQFSNSGGVALNAAGISINGSAYLRYGCKSDGEINFHGATIAGRLDCEGAKFSNPTGYALMADETKIGTGVFLRNNFKADGGVSFVSSEVKGYFAWYNVVPADSTWLSFQSAKLATLSDQETSWPARGRLFLDGFTYERLEEDSPIERVKWLRLQRSDRFLPQPYEQLAFVLRNMGHERLARAVMIEKNRDHARFLSEHGGWSRFLTYEWWWYNVLGALIGYGYRPILPFGISLVVVVIGWGVFRAGKKLMSPTSDTAEKISAFSALLYSIESFIPLFRLDQAANWEPNVNRHEHFVVPLFGKSVPISGKFVRGYLVLHVIMGWVLTTLWVGGLTGLVRS